MLAMITPKREFAAFVNCTYIISFFKVVQLRDGTITTESDCQIVPQ